MKKWKTKQMILKENTIFDMRNHKATKYRLTVEKLMELCDTSFLKEQIRGKIGRKDKEII